MNNIITFFLTLLLTLVNLSNAAADEIDTNRVDRTEESSSFLPKYGNWCGLNHPSDPLTAPPPIDTLDSICREHDYCYLANGHMNCDCDSAFIQAIKANRPRFSASEKLVAHTLRVYFRGSPCYGDQKDKIAPTRVLTGIVKQTDASTRHMLQKINALSD
ncbi:hypothetical protein A3197_11865 [Candidatus Thiodiazotropha endoloripes]|nr:hypothetical protein A3197_11865 [Candidatus Thiodiazotropha endoloripes]